VKKLFFVLALCTLGTPAFSRPVARASRPRRQDAGATGRQNGGAPELLAVEGSR